MRLGRRDLDRMGAVAAVGLPAAVLEPLDELAREHRRAGWRAARRKPLAHRYDIRTALASLELEPVTHAAKPRDGLIGDPQRPGVACELSQPILVHGWW